MLALDVAVCLFAFLGVVCHLVAEPGGSYTCPKLFVYEHAVHFVARFVAGFISVSLAFLQTFS